MDVVFREAAQLERESVLALYRSCGWSSAERPDDLMRALENSHTVITAFRGEELVGLVNSLSDGALVVYYPHLLVKPEARGRGVGTELMRRMREKYASLHQQILLSYEHAKDVYERAGFEQASGVVPFWVYSGD